jgi:cell division protein FtsI/penicillin-binding protein 2
MVRVTAAIANGGKLLQPRVVREVPMLTATSSRPTNQKSKARSHQRRELQSCAMR